MEPPRARRWITWGVALGLVAVAALWLVATRLRGGDSEAPVAPSAPTAAAGKPSTAPPAAQVPPRPEPRLHRLERRMMGTVWAVTVAGGEEDAALATIARALDEVARLETVLSEWMPASEVSAVNRGAGRAPVKVGPDLMTCMKASQEIARWSEGAFDVSWAALRDLWDFSANSRHLPPTEAQVRARLPLWNWRNIRVDEASSTVFLTQAGMQIGLGGIAKGYAADRAGAILLAAGFNDFLVFAGGQVLVHGKRGDRAWRVGIQHPRDPTQYFGYVEVTDGSVATSGDYEHSFFHDGRRYHHIIDPKTGFPSDKTASVTLIAPSGLWADAADTAVFVMGPQRGLAALPNAPGGPFEAAIVSPDLTLSTTPGLERRLLLRTRVGADRKLGPPLPPDAPAETLAGTAR